MNIEKRLTALEESMPCQDIETIYRWLEQAPYEEGCRVIDRLSDEQWDELRALTVERYGPSTIDTTKFTDEEMEKMARGEWGLYEFGIRARELGLI